MICPKCGSDQVKIEVVQETTMKQKRKGWLYWLLIGWWWEPILWLFLTVPKLLIEIFRPRRYKMQTKTSKMGVCQACGHSWEVWLYIFGYWS